MAIYTLDFLNKNRFRRFPFKAETTLKAINGKTFNNDLIVGLSISTTIDRKNLYINQIYVKDRYISIVLSATVAEKTISLGKFSGAIVEDYSVLYLEQFERFVSGTLIIGSMEDILKMDGSYYFEPSATSIEESTVFCYTPPNVKSIVNNAIHLRGNVEFGSLTNLVKTTESQNIKLSTVSGTQIASLADKSSQFRNCPTPLIYSINNAVPFKDSSKDYPILDGNIYMVGIKPIVFYGEFGAPGEEETVGGTILAQTIDINNNPLTLDTLCTARNKVLPPINPVYLNNRPDNKTTTPTFVGKENYYTKSFIKPVNFIKVVEPEFLSWPQFFKNFTNYVTGLPQGSQKEIITVPQGKTGTIKRIVLRNSPTQNNSDGASLNLIFRKNNVTIVEWNSFNLTGNQAITVNGVELSFAAGDVFSVYLNQVTGDISYMLQIILFYR
jgi:hypothetical protein